MLFMEGKITFRALIELLGKPKQHVDDSMRKMIQKLREDERYRLKKVETADLKKQEQADVWATFSEVEIEVSDIPEIMEFCFDYMPSLIEILEPKELVFTEGEVTAFLSDMQAKLHHIDMVAKNLKLEADSLKQNQAKLLRNYITLLLRSKKMTAKELGILTGVEEDTIADFLDYLIDQKYVELEGEEYYLKENTVPDKKTA